MPFEIQDMEGPVQPAADREGVPLAEEDPLVSRREFLQTTAAMMISDHAASSDTQAEAFAAQEEAYRKLLTLRERRASEVYGREAVQEAFRRDTKLFVGCMDERVSVPAGWKKIGNGGSGVLFDDGQISGMLCSLKQAKAQVREVIWHDGCGAAGIRCAAIRKAEPDAEPDQTTVAQEGAKRLAEGIPGTPVRHVRFADMSGDPHFHHARAVVVDLDGFFNPSVLPFPAAFELTAKYYPDEEQIMAELKVAIGIAFGDHGFGEKAFDREQGGAPIAVVLTEDLSDPAATAKLCDRIGEFLVEHFPRTATLVPLRR